MLIFSPYVATNSKVVYQVWRNLIGRRSIDELSNLDFRVGERSEFLMIPHTCRSDECRIIKHVAENVLFSSVISPN